MKDFYYLRKLLTMLPISSKLKGRNFLFLTIRSYSLVMNEELFLANILAKAGGNVYVLFDDGLLPHWDTYQLHQVGMPANASHTFRNKITKALYKMLFAHPNIHYINTSSLVVNEPLDNILKKYELDSTDIKNVISSVRRYFECGYYDPNNKSHSEYFDKTVINVKLMNYFVNVLYEKSKFDAVITSHGIYSIWGSAYQYFKSKNVPIYIYGAHAYKNYHTHFTDTLAQTLSLDSSCVEFMKKGELSDQIIKKVDEYFFSRRNHRTKDTSIYYSWMNNKRNMIIERKNGALNYAMFPNIIWDGDIAQRDTIFDGMLDWMKKTIEYFKYHSKNNLIIRFHPAEATLWKDTISLSKVIDELYPDLDKYQNITIIRADQQIDTYEFVKNNVDVGLIYDGILCMELTHMQIPVVSPSLNRYTGGTFVMKPNTVDEYFELLNYFDFNNYFTEAKRIEFYKYAYWYLYRSAYVMPNYSEQTFGKIVYNQKSIKKLKDPDFVKLYNKLMSI